MLIVSQVIDRINGLIEKICLVLILLSTLISALNALIRKIFSFSSNAFLEIQWYFFAAVFMLGAGYVFLKNGHVRIDFLSSKFSPRLRNFVDIFGIVFFLFPFCYLLITLSWPVFEQAWITGEVSSNEGGLIRWPVLILIPVGFSLLTLQGVSEIIKRVAFLTGKGPDVLAPESDSKVAEEHLKLNSNPDTIS